MAEALLNPLGEDDDDLETNFLIDKNIATGLAIVDYGDEEAPLLLPDAFSPTRPPFYSEESRDLRTDGALVGSATAVVYFLTLCVRDCRLKESRMVPDDSSVVSERSMKRSSWRKFVSRRKKSAAPAPVDTRPRSLSLQPQSIGVFKVSSPLGVRPSGILNSECFEG